MHFALNAWWQPLDFELPTQDGATIGGWRRIVDTSLAAPRDLALPDEAEPVTGATHRVAERSVVMLAAPLPSVLRGAPPAV
jgi:isoamylase